MSTWIETSLHDAVQALMRTGEREIAANLGRLLDEPEIKSLQLYKSPQIADLADEIFDCGGLDGLHAILVEAATAFGVAHCTIHCVRERHAAFHGTKVLTTYPRAWVSEYVARRYSTIDPVIARCLEGAGVFFWDEIPATNPITGHFVRSAMAHGIGPAGVTFVEDNARGNTIAVSLASAADPAEFRRDFRTRLSDFGDIATLMVEVFSELACDSTEAEFNPTDDQLKVLRAIASGRLMTEIEAFPFIYGSFQTVEKSILMSFGAKTLAQAAALAVRRGILENLPYFEEDIYPARD